MSSTSQPEPSARQPARQKQVTVLLHRPPEHPRTAQGLRAAVGYAAIGLRLRLVCAGQALPVALRPAIELPPALLRPRQTLLGLGCPLLTLSDDATVAVSQLAALCQDSDVVVCW